MKPIRVVMVILLIVAIILGYVNFSQKSKTNSSVTKTDQATGISVTPADNPDSWKKISFSDLGFSLSLPPDLTPNRQDDGSVSLYQAGITQKPDSPLMDGLRILISQRQLQDKQTLLDQVKTDIGNKQKALGKSFKINEKVFSAIVGEAEGSLYRATEASASFTYIYLPQKDNKYLYIIESSKDQKGHTFQTLAGLVLQTLSISQ